MALQITKEFYNDSLDTIESMSYHRVRNITVEFGGSDGTGYDVQSWIDKNDFDQNGWNGPRHSSSFFTQHLIPGDVPLDTWVYEHLISTEWPTAEIVDD